ncbi:MAG: TonB-dependent receptor [Hyphomonadaceae bacterium]|nr:TonB-dependent receptor [Hyphomonadaceae bacterium]
MAKRHNKTRKGLGLLLLSGASLAVLASAPGVASAQDAGAQADDDEIVVTARRREEVLQDVPMSVTALTARDLQDAGVNEFAELTQQVPSFTLVESTSPFVTAARIRGMGNLGNIPNFEPAVGLFVDGAYRARSGIAMGDLIDVARVEVLRGPQSVLYPKNVTAGVVSVITQRPTDEFEAWAGASGGNLEYWQLQGGVSGPLADGVRGRLAAVARDRGGGFSDIVNGTESGGAERTSVRGQLEFDVGERGNLRLMAGFVDKQGDCCSPDVLLGATSQTFMTALGRPRDTDQFNRVTAYDTPYTFDGTQYDFIAEFNYEFGWGVLTSTTSFDHFEFRSSFDAEQTALRLAAFIDRQESDAIAQEIRLTSQGDGPFSWMVGGYYYDNDFVRGSLSTSEPMFVLGADIVPLPQPGAAGDQASFRSINDTRHWSVFAQADWQVTERAVLSAGLRYIDETKEMDARSVLQVAAAPSAAALISVPVPIVGERETDGVAWNLSARFDATDSTNLYVTVGQGFKAGGFNGDWDPSGTLTAARREFADETVLTTEVGIKSRFDNASMNLSFFRSEFDDFQNASFLGTSFLVRNAESVTTQGVELDGDWRPNDWLTFDYSAAYLDSQYDQFTSGACYFGRVPTNAVEGTCDLSGNPLPNASEWRTNLGVQFETAMAGGFGFFRTDWFYSSDSNVNGSLDPRSRQDAYSLWSARLGWGNERFRVALWGENLGDETIMNASAPQTVFGTIDGGLQHFLNDPQTYGVSLEASF